MRIAFAPVLLSIVFCSILSAQCAMLPVVSSGGNGQAGYMFDVQNISANQITLTGFAVRGQGAGQMELYALNVTGSFAASAANLTTAANWTLVNSGPVTLSNVTDVPLPFSFAIPIAPGTTQAICIATVLPPSYLSFTTGAAGSFGSVIASNGAMNVRAGVGKGLAGVLPFGTTYGGMTVGVSASRLFRGSVTYMSGSVASWEVNSPESSLDFNGAHGTPCTKALTNLCAGTMVTTTLASNIPGTWFDVGFNLAPTVSSTGGAMLTAGGQLVNLDLAGGLLLLNGTLLPHPGTLSVLLPATAGITLSAQQVVLDPTHVDGINLSQAAQLTGFAIGGLNIPGPSTDNSVLTIVAGTAPLCAPALTFYGTNQTTYHVTSNGRMTWPAASTAFAPTAATAMTTAGTLGIWSDYNPILGGSLTIDIVNGVVGVNYNAVAYAAQPGSASTFRIENDSNTGILRILNIAQGVSTSTTLQSFAGISLGIGATDSGQASFSPAGTGASTNATDMLYSIGLAGTLLPGITSITFVPNVFGNYDWSSL